MSRDLTLAIQAAKLAGDLIRSEFENIKEIKRKGINDFFTKTDIEAEKLIIEHLKQTKYSILGEETGQTTNNHTNKTWIIDPIDGTSNFIRNIPFFAVSIALIENNTLLLGVIYDPIAKECFWAEKDKNAYMNNYKIHVSNCDSFDGANILLEHNRSKKSKDAFVKVLTRLMKNDGPIILRQGSTALMLCYVAAGKSDAFISSGDEIYDYAAGLIIAQEAGAVISDWNGSKWDNSNSYILASNPPIRNRILKKLSKIQKLPH